VQIQDWKVQLETAIKAKLSAEADAIRSWNPRRLDIGVFPWHGCIELSFQRVDESDLGGNIADWAHYDFSQFNEGRWPEAKALSEAMMKDWLDNHSVAEKYFQATGEIARTEPSIEFIATLFRGKTVEVTVLNPDELGSRNYAL
jgi:hypothetical protein